jgi:hypothetical protein
MVFLNDEIYILVPEGKYINVACIVVGLFMVELPSNASADIGGNAKLHMSNRRLSILASPGITSRIED